jgi:hypothetical protein
MIVNKNKNVQHTTGNELVRNKSILHRIHPVYELELKLMAV